MAWRVYCSGERMVHFTWCPRWAIASTCPLVHFYFLWWVVSIWLIPHSRAERIETIVRLGYSRDEAERTIPQELCD